MLEISLILIIGVFILSMKFVVKTFPERLFVQIFTLSSIYYGILGPWYWSTFMDSVFLRVDWSEQFPAIIFMFNFVYLIVIGTICVISAKKSERVIFAEKPYNIDKLSPAIYFFWSAGLLSCGYVYVVGGALIEDGGLISEDGLLLILFQFSDMLIGSLLFWAATKGIDKKWMVIAILFISYAIVSGFRSKIFLLIGPLAIFLFYQRNKYQARIRIVLILVSLIVIILFSVMTISRVKFSGIDLDAISDAGLDEYLYGLFAETNLLFGLASCLSIFGKTIPYAGVSPFTDIIVQLVPRFIYPEKNLYLHLKETAWWLGNSQEALDSGTAMPFFGEYYAAFGWIGVICLSVIYALLAVVLIEQVRKKSVTVNQYIMGSALVAVYIGYYYFSRGSVAQISKGLIFMCGPYFYLIHFQKRTL